MRVSKFIIILIGVFLISAIPTDAHALFPKLRAKQKAKMLANVAEAKDKLIRAFLPDDVLDEIDNTSGDGDGPIGEGDTTSTTPLLDAFLLESMKKLAESTRQSVGDISPDAVVDKIKSKTIDDGYNLSCAPGWALCSEGDLCLTDANICAELLGGSI